MAYGIQPQSDPTAVMGRRVVAYIIDTLLLSGIFIAIMAVTKNQAYTGAPTRACDVLRASPGFSGQCVQFGSRVYTWKSGGAALGYGLTIVVSFLDFVVLQGILGASIGKLILGLRVVNAEGKPCGIGRAVVRWLILLVLDGACFLIGLLTAGLTHPHRRLGDMAGGTYVVALADAGRPIPGTAPSYQYAAPGQFAPGQPVPPEWAPPGVPTAAPGWGATPPPAWGAPSAPGAPGAAQPTPGWGAPPPAAPTWGAAPPAENVPPTWGAPAPVPAPAPPTWGAPAPTPPPPAPTEPPAWNSPPPAPVEAAPTPAAPTPAAPTPAPPAAPTPAPQDAAPQDAAPQEPSTPDATPPAPAAPADGESWWNKALTDDDDPGK